MYLSRFCSQPYIMIYSYTEQKTYNARLYYIAYADNCLIIIPVIYYWITYNNS